MLPPNPFPPNMLAEALLIGGLNELPVEPKIGALFVVADPKAFGAEDMVDPKVLVIGAVFVGFTGAGENVIKSFPGVASTL